MFLTNRSLNGEKDLNSMSINNSVKEVNVTFRSVERSASSIALSNHVVYFMEIRFNLSDR